MPCFSMKRQVSSTAGCSTVVVMMCFPLSRRASAVPLMAMLSPSLPQETKTTSAGEQLISLATCSRAFSTAPATARPAQWTLEGLPNCSR